MQPRIQVVGQDGNIITTNMISEWSQCSVPELSALLSHLRHLGIVHQTSHWTAKADVFYSDHLLFERLYSNVVAEIDVVAERAVGIGTSKNVDVALQTAQVARLSQMLNMVSTIPQPNELAKKSLMAEMTFGAALNTVVSSLKQSNAMTRGIDNMLADIADKHETHVYLLKQRCM